MKDLDPLPTMPETTGRSQRRAWVAEGREVARVWSDERCEGFYVGSGGPAWTGSDMAGMPGRSHIRPIFKLDMVCAGEPERLRGLSGLKNRDREARPGV